MLPLEDVVEEFSSRTVLENEETNVVPLPNLLQLDDVGVILKCVLDSKILIVLTRSFRMLISLMNVV